MKTLLLLITMTLASQSFAWMRNNAQGGTTSGGIVPGGYVQRQKTVNGVTTQGIPLNANALGYLATKRPQTPYRKR